MSVMVFVMCQSINIIALGLGNHHILELWCNPSLKQPTHCSPKSMHGHIFLGAMFL